MHTMKTLGVRPQKLAGKKYLHRSLESAVKRVCTAERCVLCERVLGGLTTRFIRVSECFVILHQGSWTAAKGMVVVKNDDFTICDATDKLSTLDKVKKCTAWSSAGNVWLLQAALPSLRGSNKNVPATLFNRLLLLGTARRRP